MFYFIALNAAHSKMVLICIQCTNKDVYIVEIVIILTYTGQTLHTITCNLFILLKISIIKEN